jgi:linoleoyl-CoA desaturase
MQKSPKFIDKNQAEFFATLKNRVEEYFAHNHLSKNANGMMYFKSVLFLGGFVLFYLLIMSGQFSLFSMWIFALFLGAACAFIGFNVSHDAIHGSYSSNPTLNKIMAASFVLIGGDIHMWTISHNIVHHTYTNIPDHDEDIEIAPGLLRASPTQPLKGFMRYQHYYAFLLYSLASLSWVFRKDYFKFFQPEIGSFPLKHKPKDYFNLFFNKALYYTLFIVLPLLMLDITWWQFMIGFLSMHFVTGLILGLVFQLAHVVEETEFPMPNQAGDIENAWAIHQMYTTANFATNSWAANFFCGGLNMQIEHHLFPKVCHTHYTNLQPILKQTAAEFGVPYFENETFLGALQSHQVALRRFGKDALEALKTEAVAISPTVVIAK